MNFMPLKDFFSEEMGSQYVEGLLYTVADDNKKLKAEVEKWVVEEKVRLLSAESVVRGEGEVK